VPFVDTSSTDTNENSAPSSGLPTIPSWSALLVVSGDRGERTKVKREKAKDRPTGKSLTCGTVSLKTGFTNGACGMGRGEGDGEGNGGMASPHTE
jgi:hypothetical protein